MRHKNTRKPCYRKDDRTMCRMVYGCPENFWESLATPTATFTQPSIPPRYVNRVLASGWG